MTALSEKETLLLTEIFDTSENLSQRQLAQKTGISIGLINSVLKKLIHSGYVQASEMNKKKMKYLLTPHGMVQVMHKSYYSLTSTISHYQRLELKINTLLEHLTEKGNRNFYIHGKGELADMFEMVLRKSFKDKTKVLKTMYAESNFVVLNLTDVPFKNSTNVVNFLDFLKGNYTKQERTT